MFVYLMKCANYYKIGYSKNPNNRRSTIQTHNPLDVKICALLKTENAQEIEKGLHGEFSKRRTRGEWFELKHEDLKRIEIQFGFTFKIKRNELNDDSEFDNTKSSIETKKYRELNYKVNLLKEYAESILLQEIENTSNLRLMVTKYGYDLAKEGVTIVLNRYSTSDDLPQKLRIICQSIWLKKNKPREYFMKRFKSMFWNKYKYRIDAHEELKIDSLYLKREYYGGIDEILKTFNKLSFRFDLESILEELQSVS